MKKYYAVIDTNVIISYLLTRNNDAATVKIITAALDGKILPVCHKEIFAEYKKVLSYEKFHFPKKLIRPVLKTLKQKCLFLDRTKTFEEFKDKDDIVFYEVTMTAKEKFDDSYLITGNLKHFPKKPFVVTPSEMIEILEKE